MMPRPLLITRRLLSLALFLALLAAAGVVIVQPTLALLDTDASRADMRATIARFRHVAADLPRLRSLLAGPAATPASARIAAPSDTLAVGDLDLRLGALAAESKVDLVSTQAEPLPEPNPRHRIAITVEATGSLEAIQRFVHATEAGRPLLFVQPFELRPAGESEGAGGPAPQNGALRLRATIAGYRDAGPDPRPDPPSAPP
jgi:hypothetical protein